MATAPDVDNHMHGDEQGLKELKQEITCPLCLDTFREPKLLSCDHVYCKSPCLEALIGQTRDFTISCPECRVITQMTANDLNSLRTAFHINRLKEVVGRMKKCPSDVSDDTTGISTGGSADRLTVNMFCNMHPTQRLDIFCSTCSCQRLICRDCVVIDRTHENHDYNLVEKVAPGYKKALLESLNPVQETQGKVAEALSQVGKAKTQVAAHGDALERHITHSFDEIAAVLQRQKEVLVALIRELEKADLQDLSGQEKNLCIASDELTSLMTSAQTASKLSHQEFFAQRQDLLSRIGLTTRFKTELSLTPVATFPHVRIHMVNAVHKVENVCKEFSILYEPVDPSKCRTEGVQNVATVNEPSSFKLYLSDSYGNPCSVPDAIHVHVELTSLRFGAVLPAQVIAISPSCYKVTYTPQLDTRGRCRLDVTVENMPTANCSFMVQVKYHPKQLGNLCKMVSCSRGCYGLSFNPQGNLFVVTCSYREMTNFFEWVSTPYYRSGAINLLNSELVEEHHLTRGICNWLPYSVAVDSSTNVYVSNHMSSELHKFKMEGTSYNLKKSMGSAFQTYLPGRERKRNGLGISKDNKLYVCNGRKHQIEVFSSELTLLNHFGEKGSGPSQFNVPHDIAFDNQGNIYVTESGNYRIQVLSQEGKFIHAFGTKGDEPGQFQCPNWIHVNGDFVYVTDCFTRYVSVFNVSGEFIHRFGASNLECPEGIVVDEDGFVYVADSNKNAIFIF